MYVCLCHGVSDKQIVEAVKKKGVCNLRMLAKELKVATQCGKCKPLAQQIIAETKNAKATEKPLPNTPSDDSQPTSDHLL